MARTKKPENQYRQSAILAAKTIVKPVTLNLPPAHPLQFKLINALDEDPKLRFVVGACGTA